MPPESAEEFKHDRNVAMSDQVGSGGEGTKIARGPAEVGRRPPRMPYCSGPEDGWVKEPFSRRPDYIYYNTEPS